ncbi:guanine nucleotide-binding protein-like 3 isoform X1 [Zalophus californianus]|uniref:Guanine nucleotide-binding protein-like 3 n=1 Tax=Zalophus californianus TaxID=9704 RepID=A0A6J2C867_ZALCA|nr:guanine nucleotide-binding protein-like 3 isoform X1 [Zalophus californianus]XP_035581909.1 guanine nucleotide-binding protein-like 3 isoform X1 [Zalophus californianus]
MKRPKLKKASKRMTCHKRYKIQKKVREHHRKLRKEAKKRGRKKPRKDPGVPNSAPFKEALLREAELRKQRLEELKQQQKLDRQKEQEKKRKLEINPGVKPSNLEPVKEEFGHGRAKDKPKSGKQNPKKLYCQELKKVIEASDVVLEVLDARDPLGCRCPQVEEAIIQDGQKKLVLVLNKSDLVPKENLENWLNYLKKELPTVVFRASTNKDKGKIIKHLKVRKRAPFKSEVCVGKDSLWKLLRGFQEACGKAIQVGVIGFPNVGKSSIINNLKQERICNVGISMGLTRCMHVVPLDKQITVLDSPSLIVSPLNSASALALRSPASIEVVKPVEAASAILAQADARQVEEPPSLEFCLLFHLLKFTVPDFKNPVEFFTSLAQRRGLHRKGGSPNLEGAAKLMWSEWTGASLGYYCHPPTSWTPSPHFNEGILTNVKQDLNLDELEKNNAHSIRTIRGPRLASSILFQSSGLTNGIIEEKDVPEELPKQKEKQQEEGENYSDLDSDQESVEEAAGEKSLDMSGAEEAWEALPEESQADEFAHSYISDKMTEEEDDAYDFSTDYV